MSLSQIDPNAIREISKRLDGEYRDYRRSQPNRGAWIVGALMLAALILTVAAIKLGV